MEAEKQQVVLTYNARSNCQPPLATLGSTALKIFCLNTSIAKDSQANVTWTNRAKQGLIQVSIALPEDAQRNTKSQLRNASLVDPTAFVTALRFQP